MYGSKQGLGVNRQKLKIGEKKPTLFSSIYHNIGSETTCAYVSIFGIGSLWTVFILNRVITNMLCHAQTTLNCSESWAKTKM